MKEIELVNKINFFLKEKNVLFENEIRMGIGIPDVIFSLGLNCDQVIIKDYFMIKFLVDLFKFNKKNIDLYIKKTKFKQNDVKKYIKESVKMKILKIEDSTVFFLKELNLNIGHSVSIEVKVRDWKSGIAQARRYLNFSDYSYLALPKEFYKNIDIEELKLFGIGLLIIDNDNIEEYLKPKKSTKCDPLSKYVSVSSIIEKNISKSNDINSFHNLKQFKNFF